MQAVIKPKIILHVDVNKTLIAEDKNNGKDLHLVLSTAIAEKTVYEWSPDKICSYYDHVKELVPGKSYDQEVKKRRLRHFKHFIEWINKWRDEKTGEPHPKRDSVLKCYQEMMKIMEGKLVFPSFFKLIEKLKTEKYDFTIVLRTFGDDRKQVAREIEKLTSLRFTHWGEFKEGMLHLSNETIDKADAIYKKIIGENNHFAIKDNWQEWNTHKEKSAFGKRFIFDPTDPNVISIFIDDNIKADGSDEDIVSPLSIKNGALSVKSVLNQNVFIADTIQAIKEDDYFIDIFNQALKKVQRE